MSTDNPNVQAAAPNALQDFTSCPEWGMGGQFMYDPVSQTRTRIGEAPSPAGSLTSAADNAPAAAGPTTSTKAKKVTTDA